LRDATAKTGVPKSTLNNRQNGTQPATIAHENKQKLAPEIEKNLVEWILAEDRAGLPPTYVRIRIMVKSILDVQGDKTGLGEKWHYNFVKRYSDQIKIASQRAIDADRVDSCYSLAISKFFDRYETLIK
jgi:Tc5 transposase DNA-binding domain